MTSAEKETTLKELESNLWETAESLRNDSSLTSRMYYMPVLGISFLDMRNYFHVIDTTHNDWTPWQIKDIAAISSIWRGEAEKYEKLSVDYKVAIAEDDAAAKAAGDATQLRAQAAALEGGPRSVAAALEGGPRSVAAADGTEPVPPPVRPKGWRQAKKELLAKAAHAEALAKARDEIAEKKFSLNPGAYVGVAAQKDDGVDFTARMKEIHAELMERQTELGKIMKSIDGNLKELGL